MPDFKCYTALLTGSNTVPRAVRDVLQCCQWLRVGPPAPRRAGGGPATPSLASATSGQLVGHLESIMCSYSRHNDWPCNHDREIVAESFCRQVRNMPVEHAGRSRNDTKIHEIGGLNVLLFAGQPRSGVLCTAVPLIVRTSVSTHLACGFTVAPSYFFFVQHSHRHFRTRTR